MLRKVKAKLRRRRVKKVLKDHASEVIVGVALGLLTDILTDVVRAKMKKSLAKRLRGG